MVTFRLTLLLGNGITLASALPKACTGVCTNSHDPAVIARPDGTYFRFSTGGRIAVHTAPDLTGPWTYRGAALPKGSTINLRGNQDLWAPDVTELNGTYYLYYSVSTFGSQTSAIGVAVSASLDVGTWNDLGSVVASDRSKPYNAIDGNLISISVSDDGNDGNNNKSQILLSFGSFWNGLYQIPLTFPPTAIHPGAVANQVSYDRADSAQEAPVVFKHGEYYYLFYSKGTCCGYDRTKPPSGKEYRIAVCRSTVPTGEFVDKAGVPCVNGGGTVILRSHDWVYGPGGQGVYRDVNYGPIIYYHYVDTRVGFADGQKRFGWNQLDFASEWPEVL